MNVDRVHELIARADNAAVIVNQLIEAGEPITAYVTQTFNYDDTIDAASFTGYFTIRFSDHTPAALNPTTDRMLSDIERSYGEDHEADEEGRNMITALAKIFELSPAESVAFDGAYDDLCRAASFTVTGIKGDPGSITISDVVEVDER